MKNVLLLIGGLIGSVNACESRCGDKELQVFFLADMSMNLCSNDTMVKYLEGVAEFAKQAEAECSGGFGIGYGVLGDRSDVNPLFCHRTILDVKSTSADMSDAISKFDFNDGVGQSTKAHIGELYQRVSYQNWHTDALKLIITLTNDEFTANDGTEPAKHSEYGTCADPGCDCPGPYWELDTLSQQREKKDVNLGFIVTHEIADFYRNANEQNGWNAVVEEGVKLPPTDQLWSIVQAFTKC